MQLWVWAAVGAGQRASPAPPSLSAAHSPAHQPALSMLCMQDGLDKVHVPYSYGYSIILLTLIVKLVTFPLTKQQASIQG